MTPESPVCQSKTETDDPSEAGNPLPRSLYLEPLRTFVVIGTLSVRDCAEGAIKMTENRGSLTWDLFGPDPFRSSTGGVRVRSLYCVGRYSI